MRWTTTDPRTAGFQDRQGATINYVSAGAYVTLQKVGTTATDWAAVDAVITAAPMTSAPIAATDPRTAGRAGQLDEIVLYSSAGAGTYLIKYGTGDTDWVPLPVAYTPTPSGVTPGSYTSTDLTVDVYGHITAASNGSSAATTMTSLITGTGYDGALNFDGTSTVLGIVPSTVTVSGVSWKEYVLDRSINPTTVVIGNLVRIKANGYMIIGTVSLTGNSSATSVIHNNGTDGAAGTAGGGGGAGGPGGDLAAGGAGGNGALNAASSPTSGAGVSNMPVWVGTTPGAGGIGVQNTGPGTAGTAGGVSLGGGGGGRNRVLGLSGTAESTGSPGGTPTFSTTKGAALFPIFGLLANLSVQASPAKYQVSTGGGGGISGGTPAGGTPTGGSGGGGGGGGGYVLVIFPVITGVALESKGGAGGAGTTATLTDEQSSAPGGGGGGGCVIVGVASGGTFPTSTVAGGAAGAQGGSGGSGVVQSTLAGAGGGGKVFELGF